jgi:hypothetical protein
MKIHRLDIHRLDQALYKLEKFSKLIFNLSFFRLIRDIAQLGRAPALGAGCRRFKSYYPDIEITFS